ncbi:MAG: hypothetical protein WKG00_26260 [Polyangiaceae bacterium]
MATTRSSKRFLLAHDIGSSTCDALLGSLDDAFDDLEVVEAYSVADAENALEESSFDACLVCLDLPPAPLAGVRLAQAALREASYRDASRGPSDHGARPGVVLVTRSLRWLPATAAELRNLPWCSPTPGRRTSGARWPMPPASPWVPPPPTSDVVLARGLVPAAAPTPRRRGRFSAS